MNLTEILEQANRHTRIIADLKRRSEYYPEILIDDFPKYNPETPRPLYASTLVRINRNDKWYTVHCVECITPTKDTTERHLLMRVMDSVHKIQNLYQITGKYEEEDKLQISEEERLKNDIFVLSNHD